ncbi:MAG: ion channel [Pseudomonadota bacterium]|jgi:hypothetical protein
MMLLALAVATVLFVLSIISHLGILGVAHSFVDRRGDLIAKLTVSLLVLFSHLFVAALFAVGFWIGIELDLGSFDKTSTMGWMDYFYFSLINVTTLGLGDIYPTQHLRVLAGIEALTGFALISCSAQLFWKMMTNGEKK